MGNVSERTLSSCPENKRKRKKQILPILQDCVNVNKDSASVPSCAFCLGYLAWLTVLQSHRSLSFIIFLIRFSSSSLDSSLNYAPRI